MEQSVCMSSPHDFRRKCLRIHEAAKANSINSNATKNESTEEENAPIVGMKQVYSNRKVITLTVNATVENLVHIVLLRLIKVFQRFQINHINTINDLLPELVSESNDETLDDNIVEVCDGKYVKNIVALIDFLQKTTKNMEEISK